MFLFDGYMERLHLTPNLFHHTCITYYRILYLFSYYIELLTFLTMNSGHLTNKQYVEYKIRFEFSLRKNIKS